MINTKLTSNKGNNIVAIDKNATMFPNANLAVKKDGSMVLVIDTEIIKHVDIKKSKVTALMPVLNYIAKDWSLNLSRTQDKVVANKILVNSIKNN